MRVAVALNFANGNTALNMDILNAQKRFQTQVAQQSVTEFISMTAMNLVTPKGQV